MHNGPALEPAYFSNHSWAERVRDWLQDPGHVDRFLDGNVKLVRQVLEHQESGLRMVVNIPAHALLAFLAEGRYLNLYDQPVIGGARRTPSPERIQVDSLLGFGQNAGHYYFGAVALGGTGVRFYGEYCMALRTDAVPGDTRLIDRDSYDLLLPPIADEPSVSAIVPWLQGTWDADRIDMITLKLLPELRGATRLVTTGTVSAMILHDQEFVEVHKHGAILPSSIEEVRQSPDDVALEARVLSRASAGFAPSAVELRWIEQRELVVRALERDHLRHRIVTLHGKGYQWR